MATFHYTATDSEGKPVDGTLEATDRIDLAHKLKKEGIAVITADEEKKSGWNMNITIPFLSGVSAHDKIIFAQNLASMIGAGLPLTRALSVMERQSKGELKTILGKLIDEVSKGKTLSESMKAYPKVFSELFIAMVKAGEESGNLVTALKNVALQLEKSYLLTKKIKGAMTYPAVILSLMAIIGVLMMIYVVPTLSSTFESLGAQLPLSTRIIIGLANGLKEYIGFVVIAILALVALCMWFFRTKTGKRLLDWAFLHLPIVGEMTREVNSARTARTISSLISSGVDIIVALGVTEEVVQNSFYKAVINHAQAAIQKGEPISKIFSENTKLYPVFVGEMIAVGEETGNIGEMLLGVAEFYENDVDQKTKDMSAIIEPVLMIIIGAAVGIFAISMITPIYSLSSVIS